MNLSGGSSGITRKNASTVVSAVGTNDSAPMNTTSGESRRYGSSLPRRAALKLTPPYCVVLTGCCAGDVPPAASAQPEDFSWLTSLAIALTACWTVSCPAAAS